MLLHEWKRQWEAGDVRERLGLCKSVDNPNKRFPPIHEYVLILEITNV